MPAPQRRQQGGAERPGQGRFVVEVVPAAVGGQQFVDGAVHLGIAQGGWKVGGGCDGVEELAR
jgi:hypothetical protein